MLVHLVGQSRIARKSTNGHADPVSVTAHNPVRTQSDPPLPLFEIKDRGHYADPNVSRLRAFVERRGGTITDLGICQGTVIEGGNVKLGELNAEEKDDL